MQVNSAAALTEPRDGSLRLAWCTRGRNHDEIFELIAAKKALLAEE
jgi:hypothetical protein